MPFEMDSTISIHAPREGGDRSHLLRLCHDIPNFNPRPPRGGRPLPPPCTADGLRFQSTPPARGATHLAVKQRTGHEISIHAPREGGDCSHTYQQEATQISIHAPREGGDRVQPDGQGQALISIHAPREGGDLG